MNKKLILCLFFIGSSLNFASANELKSCEESNVQVKIVSNDKAFASSVPDNSIIFNRIDRQFYFYTNECNLPQKFEVEIDPNKVDVIYDVDAMYVVTKEDEDTWINKWIHKLKDLFYITDFEEWAKRLQTMS